MYLARNSGSGRRTTPQSARLRFEALEERTVPTVIAEVEANNTFGTAQAVSIATGDVTTKAADDWLIVQGSVASGSDADYFSFTLTSPSGVFFDLDSIDVGLSSTLDTVLTLYNSGGTEIPGASNDDGYDFEGFAAPAASTGSATSRDASLYFDLAAGTYAIRLTSLSSTTGNYNLRLLADSTYSAAPPVFHSNAGAADTLYLDFDGHAATDVWGTYTAAPYDFNGVSNQFSPAERLAIQNTWKVISEDYSPFAINITTAAPAGAMAAGQSFRMVYTNSDAGTVGQSNGILGVSYVGVYGGSGASYRTSFTFAGNFWTFGGGTSGQIVAKPVEMGNTSAHEFGHALGLSHYASGNYPNALMGTPDAGLNRETWAVGTTTSGGTQNDMTVISGAANTFGYRADEHGATTGTATALTATGNRFLAIGRIEQVTDADWFRFTASGPITIAVDADDYITDLDVVLRLRDSSGAVLATSDPSGSFDASISQTLAGGTYYVDVQGTGAAGVAGQYSLRITSAPSDPPVLSGIEAAALAYTENESRVITAALAVADPDGTSLQGATVMLLAGYAGGQDVLDFTNQNGISGSYANGTLTLTGTASLANYQTALRSIQYRNSSENPSTATRTVSFRVTDTGGNTSNVATRTINVTAVNDAPTADADVYSTNEDTPLTVAAGAGVLNGDTDPDSGTLTAVLVNTVQHGTLALAADGSFTYTPAANYTGPDTFTYRASDGSLTSNLVTVTLTVNAINDAPSADDEAYTTNEDTPLTVAAGSGVLVGDTDPEGSALTAVLVGDVQHGTLTLNQNGSFTYTPATNYNGTDSFTYRASDGSATSNLATVTLTITAVNDAPVADNDAYSVAEGGTLTVAAGAGVLTGDTDPEGSPLTAVLVGNVQHGSLTLNPDGSFTYTPAANYNGTDSFTYRAGDGSLNSNLATVTITVNAVNNAPVADDDAYSVNEDGTLSIAAAAGVLGGDTDPEGSPLTAVLVGNVQHGTLSLNPNGSFTYTPAANYNGPDTFTYRASDGSLTSNLATVTITVNAVNDAPAAQGDAHTVAEDGTLTVGAPGVLGNDTDADGNPLTAVQVAGPAHGSVTLNPNGSFVYTPATNYSGADSFTYRASDGALESAAVTVNLTVTPVNDAPVAVGEGYTADQNTPLIVGTPGVLGNDTDIDGDGLSAVLVAGPAHGTLTLNPNGSFTYTPATNYNGTDSFTYRASDGTTSSSAVTVNLTVTPENLPPVVVDDAGTAVLRQPLTLPVLANDSDPEGGALTIRTFTQPGRGSIQRVGNTFVYTATGPVTGADSFTYTAADPEGNMATATVQLTLIDVEAPTLNAVRARYGSAGTATVDLMGLNRTSLPWVGLTRLDLGFSEGVTVSPSALSLVGPNGAVPLTFIPGPAGSLTAAWTFPALTRGMYTLVLSATGVVDPNGNAMVGDYNRRFGMLPGDFDGNGRVDSRDLSGLKKKYQSSPALADRFADINGDGIVNVQDYNLAKAALGSRL